MRNNTVAAVDRLRKAGRVREAEAAMTKLKTAQRKKRERPPRIKGRWLYRLWSADNTLLYVGIADRGRIPEREHARNKPWWPEVHHVTVERVAVGVELKHLESRAIRTEHPKYNN